MAQPSRILIYGLLNPITEELFYIGQTRKRREFRLLEHIEKAVGRSHLPVHEYIRQLMSQGRIPSIFVIEKVDPELADESEIYWIQHFGSTDDGSFPMKIAPKTSKSVTIVIRSVRLSNVEHLLQSNKTKRQP